MLIDGKSLDHWKEIGEADWKIEDGAAIGKWNTYEITAQGPHLIVVLNGVKTVDVQDRKHDKGVIALQHGVGADKKEGAIKFRKVEIKPL